MPRARSSPTRQAILEKIVDAKLLPARATYGFFPARAEGDDIVLADGSARSRCSASGGQGRLPLARGLRLAATAADHLGAFIVTAGLGTDELAATFEAQHDDYSAIMAKALADRLAEAAAEWLHHRVRVEWGYGADEASSRAQILAENYRGIRPAFGYPACPDHTPKGTLFTLLDNADHHQVSLTESFAMTPTASVSGLYFAHPDARYFAVGRLRKDQVADYAGRMGITPTDVARMMPSLVES